MPDEIEECKCPMTLIGRYIPKLYVALTSRVILDLLNQRLLDCRWATKMTILDTQSSNSYWGSNLGSDFIAIPHRLMKGFVPRIWVLQVGFGLI